MKRIHSDSAVAVIGMACRLPGAKNIDQFWDLVRSGRTAWGPVPEDRFNRRLYFDPERGKLNKSYSDLAALVDYGPIDRSLCPISDAALASHDLAHVTLCEVAAAACRHAGLDPAALPYDNTGVYVGHASASGVASELTYASFIAQTAKYLREAVGFEQLSAGLGDAVIAEIVETVRRDQGIGEDQPPLYLGASLAARLIADTFALSGPCMSFNAACASSSRALAQGMRALQSGSVDMAIAGGASFFHSDTLVLFAQSHSLSPNGSCPFSDQANGMVVGEGYVVLLLKMLGRAIADGDRLLAVLPSVGSSSDGHGKSLWAPRFEGQVKAIQRAYGPEVSMQQLRYIEAHATSTSLGDVTEVKALTTVLDGQLPPGMKLPVGSAKLNVGHTLESAGLVGVLKTVLALEHQAIPPTLGEGQLNPEVDWDRAPLYVPRQEVAWPQRTDGVPRRAGVNAFGIGGLNVHVVVDEYLPAPVAQAPGASFAAPAAAPRTPRAEADAIAIIGMGAVLPGALARDAYWELLQSGRDAKTEVTPDRWDADAFVRPGPHSPWEISTKLGGFITGFHYDWRKHKIPPKQIQQASPLQFMILDAVDQAIQQAGYHQRPFDRQQVGVVVGTVFGGDYSAQLVMGLRLPNFQELLSELLRGKGLSEPQIEQLAKSYGEVLLKHMPALLDETGSFTASALASRITKSFDLMGGAVAIDAGQASSFAALSCCVDQLRSGDCEMMICVGGQNDMTPTLYADWATIGRLASGSAGSPFDVQADGTVPGEGCGALLLKRLADARRDNDPILGILRGIGAAHDRSAAVATRRAVGRALAEANLSPADVSLVEVSPSGESGSDAAEIQGLAAAYGDRRGATPLPLGTAVGQIGDTGGASGMASLLKAAWEVERVEVPAGAVLERTAPHLTRLSAVLAVPTQSATIVPSNSDGRLIAGIHSGGNHEVSYHVFLERGTKLKATNKPTDLKPQSAASPTTGGPAATGGITHFDATARRRDKMRQHAAGSKLPARPQAAHEGVTNGAAHADPPKVSVAATAHPAVAAPAARPQPPTRPTPPAQAVPSATAPQPAKFVSPISAAAPKPNGAPHVAVTPPPAPVAAASAAAGSEKLDRQELEAFLVNFVVEHTGYPAEIVELDADLEADLGIDSIKKAQLFGELGEYFEVAPSDDLSLDDFPTLRHVLEYLLKSQGGGTSAPVAAAAPTPQQAAMPVRPASVAPQSNGTAHAAISPPAAVAPAAAESPSSTGGEKLDRQELEAFLVNFVVEHTGYPAEIVELDADLEADLGIDSIKKAQLFGELGEYFEVAPSDDLSLDDFPTLRHVLEYLLKSQGGAPAAAAPEPAAATGHTAPAVAKPNGLVHEAVSAPASAPVADAPMATGGEKLDRQELEAFLVNFVVEHTGYPAEIVELDADLEADLGIDSIKKAQLFGELGEYFEVAPSDDLSLDDFPTLRHVLEYLLKSQSGNAAMGR